MGVRNRTADAGGAVWKEGPHSRCLRPANPSRDDRRLYRSAVIGFGAMISAHLSTLLGAKVLPAVGYAWIIAMLPWAYGYRLLVHIRQTRAVDTLPISYTVILWLGLVLTLESDALLLWSIGRFV